MKANRVMLDDVCELVSNAGVKLRKSFGCCDSRCKEGRPHDLVTDLDHSTEDELNTGLLRLDPEIGFEGEEFGVVRAGNSTARWLVDPIDGTFHYVRGIPQATTMLALVEDGVVTLSIIHNFVTREMFTALRDYGAYRNGERIQVSERTLHGSCMSVEMRREGLKDRVLYDQIRDKTMIYHTLNCGFEFGLVASGKLDGRIMYKPWGTTIDFAPGSLLVQEAGGVVTNLGRDREYDLQNLNLMAVNPLIYRELTEGDHALFPIEPLPRATSRSSH